MTHKATENMVGRERSKVTKYLKELTIFKQALKVFKPAQLSDDQKRNIYSRSLP